MPILTSDLPQPQQLPWTLNPKIIEIVEVVNGISQAITDGTLGGTGGLDVESIRDTIGNTLVPGTNINIVVNDPGNTVTVATAATVNATDAQLRARSTHTGTQPASTIADLGVTIGTSLGVTQVTSFGAVGDGTTLNNVPLNTINVKAVADRRIMPYSTMSQGSTVITFPPGDFVFSSMHALLGSVQPSHQSAGITIRGAGARTNVIFDHVGPGALCFNNLWQRVRFEGINFICSTGAAGSTFLQSYTTSAAQDYVFYDCSWRGPWKYVIDLQGDNNNSEYRFIACSTSLMQNDGAFLYSGTVNTSDQFLNYWFYGFKHWSTSAPLVDMARGGHVHMFGVDVSSWGLGLTAPGYIIYLRGNDHARGVCNVTAEGFRVEAKSVFAGLLYSEWNIGNVSFRNADWSSQVGTYTYGDIIDIRYTNVGGPIYTFESSALAGGVKVTYAINDWQHSHRIIFRECNWAQKLTPSEVVTYVEPTTNLTKPVVEFIRCRGTSNSISNTGGGAAVWDAAIGYAGETLYALQKKSVSIRGTHGPVVTTASPLRMHLPIGALITGLHAVCPAGVGTETTDGTWTLATTEAVPVTICSVTPPVMNAGYDLVGVPATPFLCDTRDRATVTVTPTNLSATPQRPAILMVEGYW